MARNIVSKTINNLGLNNVGLLEMTFALTPMLSGFNLGSIPLSALMWIILIILCIVHKGRHPRSFWPLVMLFAYWFVHEFIMFFTDDVNLTGFIVQIFYFVSVFFLYPNLNIEKIKGSMNWVALIAIVGLLYQWSFILRGQGVHPLQIPGLSSSEFILEKIIMRPSSFFMEPAAYASFMMCPLALALIDKKWVWSAVMILSIFLTTSTTGLMISFILLGMTIFSKQTGKTALVVVVIAFGLFYSLNHFEVFSGSVSKLESTEIEGNVRLSQGLKVVASMRPSEYIFGVPYSSAYNYCSSGRMMDVEFYGDSVYMATFWNLLLLYGIVGLILYLNIYYKLFKTSRQVWPLLLCLVAVMFSSGYSIGGSYIFTLIILLVVARSDMYLLKQHFR